MSFRCMAVLFGLSVSTFGLCQSISSMTVTTGHSYGIEGGFPLDTSYITISASFNPSTHWSAYYWEVKAKYYDSSNNLLRTNDWTAVSGSSGAFGNGTSDTSDSLVGPDNPPQSWDYVVYQYRCLAAIYNGSTPVATNSWTQTNCLKLWYDGSKIAIDTPPGW